MTVPPTMLAIASLRRDGGTQPRDHISFEIATEYAEALVDGAILPPVTVFYDGADYWLADGFHRTEAHSLLDRTEIAADIRQGTRRDAVLYSAGANADHGYRRSNMDKRRAVAALLNDPEWAQWSDREIARRCNVVPTLVGKLRPPPSLSVVDSEVRTYIDRHGNPSHMRTGSIGKTAPDLPTIAGRKAERKPDLNEGRSAEVGIPTAAVITGLSIRNVTALARAGEIEGARKEGSSWVIPTEPLKAMVRAATAPIPEPPAPYDHAANRPMLAVVDRLEDLITGPTPDEMLAWWRRFVGAGFADGAIERAFNWITAFRTGFPEAERERRALLERIDSDVAQ